MAAEVKQCSSLDCCEHLLSPLKLTSDQDEISVSEVCFAFNLITNVKVFFFQKLVLKNISNWPFMQLLTSLFIPVELF